MNVSRPVRSVGICLALALTLYGCGDSDSPTSPSPTPGPNPTPGSSTFTITGTVAQTAPTAHRTIEGAQVTLSTGLQTTTNAQGVFTFANVANGSYLLTAQAADHQEQTLPVTVAGANLNVQVNLSPASRTVESEYDARIDSDDPPCHGGSHACDRYETGAHHSGTIEATVTWTSSDATLDLQVRCDGELVASGTVVDRISKTVTADVEGGRACEVHVLLLNNVAQDYSITLKFPY